MILRDEHRSLSAVLSGLKELSRMAYEATERPDFKVFRAMLRYIDEYPERLHHPKEDEYLFARLAARLPEAKPLLDELQAEHVEGARRIRDLERTLLFLEDRWPVGAREFRDAVEGYSQFHWSHMRKEEEKVMPLAERHLSEADWSAIDDAFAGNQDPIADLREKDFQALFSRIASIAPAPVGLGEPWKQRA
jgi:branched-chain amino acid transport system ATP-binding protein